MMKVEIEVEQIKELRRVLMLANKVPAVELALKTVNYWLVGTEDESPPPLGIHVSDAVVAKDRFGG